jgi:hypothetical protein
MNMKLDKKAKSTISVYAIILIVYVLAFLIVPFNKNAASWISFFFTIIAIVSSLFVCGCAFKAKETLVSKIYGFPIFRVGVVYAIAQLIVGIIICAIATFVVVPYWVALLLSVLFLGAAAIGVIVTDNTRDLIEEIDDSVKVETENVTFFQINIAGIVDECENDEVRADLVKLNELFQFSDPVSNDSTKEIEESIKAMLTDLKAIVADGKTDEVSALIKKITNALKERNRICQVTKV